MRLKRNLLIGIILGAVIGWFLGYMRLPYVEENSSFLPGLVTALICIALVIFLFFLWNKNIFLLRLARKKSSNENIPPITRTYVIILIAVTTFIVLGVILNNFFIYQQNRFFKSQILEQNKRIEEQMQMIESVRKSNQGFLINNILDNVEEELKNHDTLSNDLITRISGLSFSLKPYKHFRGDSLSAKEISPERGQLLLVLILMNIDSASFEKIKQSTSFEAADLGGADLEGVNLSNADLKGANFKGANLNNANLSGAVLRDAILWGADLNNANLNSADLKRSDLRWAILNGANLKMADMNGAMMMNAQLINADLRKAKIQWADLSTAILNKANLDGVDLMGASMRKSNLSETNLANTDLRMTKFNEANLSAAELNRALVDSTWVDSLNVWRLIGGKEIQEGYVLITDTLDQWKRPVYRLKKNDVQVEKKEIDSVAN